MDFDASPIEVAEVKDSDEKGILSVKQKSIC